MPETGWCSQEYLLGLLQLALVSIQITKVVDRIKSRVVVGSWCFLSLYKCSLTRLLCLVWLTLSKIEAAGIVDHVAIMIASSVTSFDQSVFLGPQRAGKRVVGNSCTICSSYGADQTSHLLSAAVGGEL